jgi:hypothetical protein
MSSPFRVSTLLNTSKLDQKRKDEHTTRIDNISRLIGGIPFGIVYSKDIRLALEVSSTDLSDLSKWTKIESWGEGEIVHFFEPMINATPKINREIARRRLVKFCADICYDDLFLKSRRFFTHEVIASIEYSRQAGIIPFIGQSDKCCAVSDDNEVSCDDSDGQTCIITPTGSCALGSDCCVEC